MSQLRLATLACALLAPGLVGGGRSVTAGQSSGGAFTITGTTAGGGTSSGGAFSITGYVAPSGAGTSTGEEFDITCGFLGVYSLVQGEVSLQVASLDDGRIRIWWPADVAGYQLEFTTELGAGAVWQSVVPAPTTNSWTTDPLQPAGYLRLRQP